ncbi:hypothetical protein QT21_00080, partial [Staphylococcus aureus]
MVSFLSITDGGGDIKVGDPTTRQCANSIKAPEQGFAPARGRDAVGVLEVPGHMALVEETGLYGCVRQAPTGEHRGLETVEAAQGQGAVGAGAEVGAKVLGQAPAVA